MMSMLTFTSAELHHSLSFKSTSCTVSEIVPKTSHEVAGIFVIKQVDSTAA